MRRTSDPFGRWFFFGLCFLLLASCAGGGGGDTGTADEAPPGSAGESVAGPAPRELSTSGPLQPGTYTFEGFSETLSFTVENGWEAVVEVEPEGNETKLGTFFAIFNSDHPQANIAFVQSSRVLDPELNWNEEGNILPMPDDLIEFFAEHPMHEAQDPFATTVGGREAQAVDFVVADSPRRLWPSCGGPCVTWIPIFVAHEDGPLTTEDLVFGGALNERDRDIAVEVGGEQLLIDVGASDEAAFDAFLPLAEEVLATITFGEG